MTLKAVGIKRTRSTNHYINNAEFLAEFVRWRGLGEGWESTPIPPQIAMAIMKISEGLSTKPNFSGYTFREDMVGDGIENCIKYVRNFDPKKSSNPFSYFTQICFFAFLRRIQTEAKHGDINCALIANAKLAFSDEETDMGTIENSCNVSKREFERNKFEVLRQMETANSFNTADVLTYEKTGLEIIMDE